MRTLIPLLLLFFLNLLPLDGSFSINGLGAQFEVGITAFGIDLLDNGICTPEARDTDCMMLDGAVQLSCGPGADIVLMIQYRNDSPVAIIEEISLLRPDGMDVFVPVITPLNPGAIRLQRAYFRAPATPGVYSVPLRLIARAGVDLLDEELTRYVLTVDQALPVELSGFSAETTEKGYVDLNWQTEWEVGHDRFVVERSSDGTAFISLGAIAGAGDGEGVQAYHFRDEEPLPGLNYYRLRQIDTDGMETLSTLVSATVGDRLLLYPNPATDELRLAGFSGGPVRIYDAYGRTVLHRELPAGAALDVTQLPSGTYWLKTTTSVLPWSK